MAVAVVQDAGFNMAFKPVRVKFKPSAKDVQVCEESGVDLAQAVHRVMRVQERQAGNSQVKQGTHRSWCPGLLVQATLKCLGPCLLCCVTYQIEVLSTSCCDILAAF